MSLSDSGTALNGKGTLGIDRQAVEPVQMLIRKELEQAVEEGLSRLPVNQRAALELKSLGYSLHEIADMLAITPSNAGVLVHRARARPSPSTWAVRRRRSRHEPVRADPRGRTR